jgi:hypothetical protein
MTEKQISMVNRRMKLGFDFTDYLIDNPSEIERLPDSFVIKDELDYLTPKEFVDVLSQREKYVPKRERSLYNGNG